MCLAIGLFRPNPIAPALTASKPSPLSAHKPDEPKLRSPPAGGKSLHFALYARKTLSFGACANFAFSSILLLRLILIFIYTAAHLVAVSNNKSRDMTTSVGKLKVELGPIQETLLIPLLGRAEESKKPNGMMMDLKAVAIVDALDYDFDKWRGKKTLVGATARTCMYDFEIKNFLEEHPGGTVVEIGVGLNSRYERLDNGTARWFELDLPDGAALRRKFFNETERRTIIGASVYESGWHDRIAETKGPWLFVSEAAMIYLDAVDAERTIRSLSKRFSGGLLLIDTTSASMVRSQGRHDIMRTLPPESWFRWECDDPQSIEPWGVELLSSKTFLDAHPDLVAKFPTMFRFLMRMAPWLIRRKLDDYRINLYRFSKPGPKTPDES